jgi:5'-nucleotidase, C-terminal domain
LASLENSVSLVPALEGRFPQVSNIVFEYDPKLPTGSRVQWIKVNGEELNLEKRYVLATRGYMARGKDGFDALLAKSEGGEAEEIVSEENGVLISTILRQYFLSLKVVGTWGKRNPNLSRHWGDVQKGLQEHGTIRDPRSSQDPSAEVIEETAKSFPKRDGGDSLKPKDMPTKQQASLPPRGQENTNPANATPTPSTDAKPDPDLAESDTDTDRSDADEIPITPLSTHPLLSRTAPPTSTPAHLSEEFSDNLFRLARQYAKKWMRLAGVKEEGVAMVDESSEDALPSWTKGIAPRLEGRIRIVGEKDEKAESNS